MNYLVVILLVSLSGLFSGLTLGLLGLSKTELERKIKLGNKKAEKIYKIRKDGNLLLCTLLLGNVAVNSALSIFLGSIASGFIAGLSATFLIVIFGEVLPQAFCSRFALEVGSRTVWLVRFFIIILYPVCKPIAWMLDKMLGEELPTVWDKDELAEIMKTHKDSSMSGIDHDEERIVLGALSFSDKKVRDVMTPKTVMFSLDQERPLDGDVLNKIKDNGFTRIPVYYKRSENLVGILYSKDLINITKDKLVKDICRFDKIIQLSGDRKLDEVLNYFIRKRVHMGFVYNKFGTLEGVITLEDVLEEILRLEIVDEDDNTVDLREEAIKRAVNFDSLNS